MFLHPWLRLRVVSALSRSQSENKFRYLEKSCNRLSAEKITSGWISHVRRQRLPSFSSRAIGQTLPGTGFFVALFEDYLHVAFPSKISQLSCSQHIYHIASWSLQEQRMFRGNRKKGYMSSLLRPPNEHMKANVKTLVRLLFDVMKRWRVAFLSLPYEYPWVSIKPSVISGLVISRSHFLFPPGHQ